MRDDDARFSPAGASGAKTSVMIVDIGTVNEYLAWFHEFTSKLVGVVTFTPVPLKLNAALSTSLKLFDRGCGRTQMGSSSWTLAVTVVVGSAPGLRLETTVVV